MGRIRAVVAVAILLMLQPLPVSGQSGATYSDPVSINGDAEFHSEAVLRGWAGSGTQQDPYELSDLVISVSTAAIEIRNTSVFFEIKRCDLYRQPYFHPTLILDSVIHAAVSDCTFRRGPVTLTSVYDVAIEDSTFEQDLLIDLSENVRVEGGGIAGNLRLTSTTDVEISSMAISGYWPVRTDFSTSTRIHNNSFEPTMSGFGAIRDIESNGTVIENNTFHSYTDAIRSSYSEDLEVVQNTFDSVNQAIYAYDTSLTVRENTVTHSASGLLLSHGGPGSVVTQNNFSTSSDCIWLNYGSGTQVERNLCTTENGAGLFSTAAGMQVRNNTFLGTGIHLQGGLSGWNTHVIENNTVNGSDILYWKDRLGGTVPAGYGQVILANVSFAAVEGLELSGGGHGVLMGHSGFNQIIANNLSDHRQGGLVLYFSHNNTIVGNNFSDNQAAGLYLSESPDNRIAGNHFSGNGFNWEPGVLWVPHDNSDDWSPNGIRTGLGLISSHRNDVEANSLQGNLVDLEVDGSVAVEIYHNNFLGTNNTIRVDPGYTPYSILEWSLPYPGGGNYWSDYTEAVDLYQGDRQNESGPDGIADENYDFRSGSYGPWHRDRHPLMDPWPFFGRPPDLPQNLTGIAGSGFVDLSWTPPLADGGLPVLGYEIARAEDQPELIGSTHSSRTYNDTGAPGGSNLTYFVAAYNEIGRGPFALINITVHPAVPDAPSSLDVTVGDSVVNLTWTSPPHDGGLNISHYTLYRRAPEDVIMVPISNTAAHAYSDTDLLNGETYLYEISATNLIGESLRHGPIAAVPFTNPSPPRNFTLLEYEYSVILDWDPPLDDGGFDVDVYRIFRSPPSGPWIWLGDTPETTYQDMTIERGLEHHYYITAMSQYRTSEATEILTAFVPLAPPSVPQRPTIWSEFDDRSPIVHLFWRPPSEDGGVAGIWYNVSHLDDGTWTVISSRVSQRIDHVVTPGSLHTYGIEALNSIGESPRVEISIEIDAIEPGAPNRPVARFVNDSILLEWEPTVDDGGSPITDYSILRGIENGTMEIIATQADTSYRDFDLVPGSNHIYRIYAMNAIGPGEGSSPISIIVPSLNETEQISSEVPFTILAGGLLILLGLGVLVIWRYRPDRVGKREKKGLVADQVIVSATDPPEVGSQVV